MRWTWIVGAAALFGCPALLGAERTAPPEKLGLTCTGSAYFPTPAGAVHMTFPNGDFETGTDVWPTGWAVPDAQRIANTISAMTWQLNRAPKPAEVALGVGMTLGEYSYVYRKVRGRLAASVWKEPGGPEARVKWVRSAKDAAPQGQAYLHMPAGETVLLRSPEFEVHPNTPQLLSMWVCSNTEGRGWFWFDVGLERISIRPLNLPSTDGQWKRVGIYFRTPPKVAGGQGPAHFPRRQVGASNDPHVSLRQAEVAVGTSERTIDMPLPFGQVRERTMHPILVDSPGPAHFQHGTPLLGGRCPPMPHHITAPYRSEAATQKSR